MSLWANFVDTVTSAQQKDDNQAESEMTYNLGLPRSPHPPFSGDADSFARLLFETPHPPAQRTTDADAQKPAVGISTTGASTCDGTGSTLDGRAVYSSTPQQPDIHHTLIIATVNEALEKERAKITKRVLDDLQPLVAKAATEAAERELDRLIEAVQGETTAEKMQAILTRVEGLPAEDLESLFLRRPVMVDALRRVLQRAEIEEAVGEWEDVAPGY